MGRKYAYDEWLQFECEGAELSPELEKLGEKFGERALEVASSFLRSIYGPHPEHSGISYDDGALIWNTYASIVGHGVGLWEEDGDTGLPPELEGQLDKIVKKDKKLSRLADQIQLECSALQSESEAGEIKHVGGKWVLYSRHGRVLGRHPTRDAALRQERAIHVHKANELGASDYPDMEAALRGAQSKFDATHAIRGRNAIVYSPTSRGYVKRVGFHDKGFYHWPEKGDPVADLPANAEMIYKLIDSGWDPDVAPAMPMQRAAEGASLRAEAPRAKLGQHPGTRGPADVYAVYWSDSRRYPGKEPFQTFRTEREAIDFARVIAWDADPSFVLVHGPNKPGSKDWHPEIGWVASGGRGDGLFHRTEDDPPHEMFREIPHGGEALRNEDLGQLVWTAEHDPTDKAASNAAKRELRRRGATYDDGRWYDAKGNRIHYESRSMRETPRGGEPLRAEARRQRVRFRFEDEKEWQSSDFDSFIQHNRQALDDLDIQNIKNGKRVTLGGGAQPVVFVELEHRPGVREETPQGGEPLPAREEKKISRYEIEHAAKDAAYDRVQSILTPNRDSGYVPPDSEELETYLTRDRFDELVDTAMASVEHRRIVARGRIWPVLDAKQRKVYEAAYRAQLRDELKNAVDLLRSKSPRGGGPLRGGEPKFAHAEARRIAASVGVDWDALAEDLHANRDALVDEFTRGLNIEYEEHANIVKGDAKKAALIALAHLKEDPRYYAKLKRAGLEAGEAPSLAPEQRSSEDAVPWVKITRDPEQYQEGMARAKEIGPIDNPKQIYDLLSPALSKEDQEVFLVVLLDVRQQCIGVAEVHRGARSRVAVDRSVVYRAVVKTGAESFMVVHNHPTGDPTPSPADRELTKAIMDGAEEVDVPCVDHVVIGMGRYYSFAEGKSTKVS